MSLDPTARAYANDLFNERLEEICRRRDDEAARIVSHFASRGLGSSGHMDAALLRNEIELMKEQVNAKRDALLAAYQKAGLPIDDACTQGILEDIGPLIEQCKRSIYVRVQVSDPKPGHVGPTKAWAHGEVEGAAEELYSRNERTLRISKNEYLLSLRQKQGYLAEARAARKDALTGLLDREALKSDLSTYLADETRHPVSLLMVDIDRFKNVNDQHGHQAGDEVLRLTAACVHRVVGQKGKAYRYGGEEVMVLLPNYEVEEAFVLGERLCKEIGQQNFENYPGRVTASCGVYTADSADFAELAVGRVDAALYASKDAGRNKVTLWAESLGDRRNSHKS